MRRTGTIAEDENAVKCELAAQVLRSFGTLRFVATGWSMLPSLWPGEILVVERISKMTIPCASGILCWSAVGAGFVLIAWSPFPTVRKILGGLLRETHSSRQTLRSRRMSCWDALLT